MRVTKKFTSKIQFGVTIFILLSMSISVFAAQDIQTNVDEYIDTYVDMGLFSGSILVAQEGKILISKGYGMANFELDVPNSPKTKFRIGSITKQFTALAIMQLQEKGLLSVEDPLSKFIPDYPNGELITIHNLLTHTSGIVSFTSFPDFSTTMLIPSNINKVIDSFKDKPLEFVPSTKYNYSNSGYVLLGYIIEKVTGQSYETYLQENIFQPLGMKNSGYAYHQILLKDRATGYTIDGEGKLANVYYDDATIAHAAGALYSTIEDLYLWDRALYTEKLVNKDSLAKIFTPFKNNYAYGWMIGQVFNHKYISHGGRCNGYYGNISRYVDDDTTIIILSNVSNAPLETINLSLSAMIFGEKYEMPTEEVELDSKIYEKYVGEYELSPGFVIVIKNENNQLFAQATGQSAFLIFSSSETEFFAKAIDVKFTFVMDDQGEVTQMLIKQNNQEMSAKKM